MKKARRSRQQSEVHFGQASKTSLVKGGMFSGKRWKRLYRPVSSETAEQIIFFYNFYLNALKAKGIRVRPEKIVVHSTKNKKKKIHFFLPDIKKEELAINFFSSKKHSNAQILGLFKKIFGSTLSVLANPVFRGKKIFLDSALQNWAIINGEPVLIDVFPPFVFEDKKSFKKLLDVIYAGSHYPEKGLKKKIARPFMGLTYRFVVSFQILSVLLRQAIKARPELREEFVRIAKKIVMQSSLSEKQKKRALKGLSKSFLFLDYKRVQTQRILHKKLKEK